MFYSPREAIIQNAIPIQCTWTKSCNASPFWSYLNQYNIMQFSLGGSNNNPFMCTIKIQCKHVKNSLDRHTLVVTIFLKHFCNPPLIKFSWNFFHMLVDSLLNNSQEDHFHQFIFYLSQILVTTKFTISVFNPKFP